MRLLDVLNSPWAIIPDKLLEIQAIYATHLRGDKIDIAAIEARLGRPLVNTPKNYDVVDGVAIVAVEGVLAKRANLFMQISGGMSMQLIERDLNQALADDGVHSIILAIDSPGGTVDGTQELARAVMAASEQKTVVAWIDGAMASAAYWIGSAADSIQLGADTALVGSIGVAMSHKDYSKAEERIGIKTTDIYAGKYKRIASEHAPLTEDGRAGLQAMVDQIYTVFVEAVADHRGVPVDTVIGNMADGRIFVGRQSIEAGLVDGVATLNGLIGQLAGGTYQPRRTGQMQTAAARAAAGVIDSRAKQTGAGAAPIILLPSQEPPMSITRDFITANHPDIASAFRKEGQDAVLAEGRAAGIIAERERIQAVEAQSLPGHEKLIAQLKFDGKTSGPEAAVQILAAEKAAGTAQLRDLRADAGTGAAASASQTGDHGSEDAALDAAKTPEERLKAKWDKDAKLRADFGDDFKAFAAFDKAHASGKVRILGNRSAA